MNSSEIILTESAYQNQRLSGFNRGSWLEFWRKLNFPPRHPIIKTAKSNITARLLYRLFSICHLWDTNKDISGCGYNMWCVIWWVALLLLGLHLFRLNELELHAPARPGDGPGVGRVVEEGDQELPELKRATSSWTWTNCYWTWRERENYTGKKELGLQTIVAPRRKQLLDLETWNRNPTWKNRRSRLAPRSTWSPTGGLP